MAYRRTPQIEERMHARRGEIVQAARTLLIAQGYAATTMQEVARAARTSVGNLYFHFTDKDALVQAIVAEIVHEIAARADRAESSVPRGPAQVAAATYAGVMVVLEQRALCQRVLVEPGTHALRARVLACFVERFKARLKAQPELAPEQDYELSAQASQGAMFHVLEHALLDPTAGHSAKKIGRFLACFNLRALGYGAAEVEQVVREVEAVLRKARVSRRGRTLGEGRPAPARSAPARSAPVKENA